ncbi:MAG: PQQ-binding-like beta-propeller repeat protein [Thermogutta sp.]
MNTSAKAVANTSLTRDKSRVLRWLMSVTVISAITFALSTGRADDWPQWRGPNRDGIWRESGIIEKFPGPEVKLRWRAKISGGYSGPTVAEGRVFVTDRVTEPEEMERVHAFDWRTGQSMWTFAYPCVYRNVTYRTGPRAAVTIHEGLVYALGTMGHLHCLDAKTGTLVWKKIAGEDWEINVPIWGVAAAPLVEGDLLIVQIGAADACVAALDRRTGELRWKALKDPASYSAPIVINQAGRRVVVCWTGERLAGLDSATGKLLWEVPFTHPRWIDGIITPVWDPETHRLFISCFDGGALLLHVDPKNLVVETIWRRKGVNEIQTDSLHILMGNPVLKDQWIFGVDSYGQFRCLDARTGDRLWEDLTLTSQVRWGTLHMIQHQDRVWMFNDQGELMITKLNPQGVEVISKAKLLSPTRGQLSRGQGVTWSHPAFAYRHVFNRNDEELVCADLSLEGQ